jgi:hypothetical protein
MCTESSPPHKIAVFVGYYEQQRTLIGYMFEFEHKHASGIGTSKGILASPVTVKYGRGTAGTRWAGYSPAR